MYMLIIIILLFFNFTCFFIFFFFFFFNDTATTEIYTLSLHDALPISTAIRRASCGRSTPTVRAATTRVTAADRKSTRLNSSHGYISYAVFCLKKKKKKKTKYTKKIKIQIHKTSVHSRNNNNILLIDRH